MQAQAGHLLRWLGQRFSITRALLGDPQWVVIDKP